MTRPRYFTLRAGLTSSIAAFALAPVLGAAPAFAQVTATPFAAGATPSTGSTPTENVVVTGSRLRTSNLTSEAPVTVVTAKQIEQSSAQTIEDVLRKIPSIGTEGISSTTNNGGNGASCIDLRNLGVVRTLVLVNGRRFTQSGTGTGNNCVDLDTIPVAMIDRIEILKDGASTIYGADAVAGVINIITKKNFVGTQVSLNGTITASGDDIQGDISGTTGFDFAQGRGNVALSGRYLDREPVLQKDRDWANPAIQNDPGLGNQPTVGSGIPVNPRIETSAGDFQNINGQLVPFNNATGRYPFAREQWLSNTNKTGNLSGSAHYDINSHITAYVDAFYTHKSTHEQLAGQPVTGAVNTAQSFDVPQGNPFAEALGIDEQSSLLRRFTDWGPRGYTANEDLYQGTVGLKGNITGNWDYDGYYTYGRSVNSINYTNQINFTKLEQEMGFQHTSDTDLDASVYNPGVCTSQPGCVLSNPFGAGSFSPAAIKYASFNSQAKSYYQLRDLGLTITNNKLLQLPYGPLGLALGFEHRGEDGAYHPDPTIESGASPAAAEQPTGGGFSVSEVFGELNIPILKNLPMAKDLSADISGRWSDYSTFGSVYNWKAGINWTPSRDIRFRANLGTSVRQPAIVEAFGGQTVSFAPGFDPCDANQITSYGALQGTVAANCARKGVRAGYTQPGSQIPTLVGGNPNLQPESSRTYTIGTVMTPRFIPNLSATIDYFHTKIENSIGTLPSQNIVDGCYTSANLSSPLCNQIAQRTTTGQLTQVTALTQNLGEVRTNGIDFDLNYLVRLRGGHVLSFSNELVDTIGYTEQLTPDGPFVNIKGRISAINTQTYISGYPVIRDNLTATYSKAAFSFSWTTRFIDGMKFNNGTTDAVEGVQRYARVNEVFFHDILATYNFKKIQFIAGIDNLFDRTPPFVLDGTTNTAPNVYGQDILGRLFYAKLQFRF